MAGIAGANMILLLGLVLAIEGGLRVFGISLPSLPTPETPDRALWRRDPNLGWSLRPHAVGIIPLGGPDRGLIRVNALGLRGPEVAPAKSQRTLRVLALGDSYVLGVGVDEPHLFTSQLQSILSTERVVDVVNMGVNGYSTDQQLLQFEGLGSRLAPDVVILFACDNDFDAIQEDFVYRAYYKPYFELADGGLVARNRPIPELTRGQRARLWLGQHSLLWNALRSRRSDVGAVQAALDAMQVAIPRAVRGDTVKLMERLIVTLRDEVERAGARFVLFNTAQRGERTQLFQALRPRLREQGVLFLGLEGNLGEARKARPDALWDFSDDPHWNVDAHRLAADVVANFLRQSGLVAGTNTPPPR